MTERRPLRRRAGTVALGAAGVAAAAAAVYALRRVTRPVAPAPRTAASEELELPEGAISHDITLRDHGRLHVVEIGSGPPIVLLHGVTLQARAWAYQMRDLAGRHRMIAFDLRGHGQSEPGEEGLSIAAVADDLAELLERLDLHEVTLVGHSMGGMGVLRFCRRHPEVMKERVGAVALVASAGGIAPPLAGWHRVAPRMAAAVIAGHAALNEQGRPIVPDNAATARASRFAFGLDPDPVEVRETLRFARAMRPDHFFGYLPELATFDERAAFEDLGVPSVVVVGDRDRLTPPRYARALAASLPGAELVVWPGAGHLLMYERRRELDDLLDRLSEQATSGRAPGPR